MNVKREIEDRLATLRQYTLDLTNVQAQAEAELQQVRNRFAPMVKEYRDQINFLDKEVKALGKENKGEVFGKGDKAQFKNGLLGWGEAIKVRII